MGLKNNMVASGEEAAAFNETVLLAFPGNAKGRPAPTADAADMIPSANPGAAYRAAKEEIDAAVARVLNSGYYILGKEGAEFETEFAGWQGAGRAIGCANGTDALALILRGLGIGRGDAVATVSHTAVATVAAIEMVGAVAVLVDVEPDHQTLDPDELSRVLANPPAGLPAIRAVIPVHLYGQSADLGAITAICERHGVALIEDCSQAHGATYQGRKVGTFGRAAAFSLYPTKNLGGLGDGGIIATDDPALAEKVAALRQYGWNDRNRYVSELSGINSRLDEMQAAILKVMLKHLDVRNARRGAIAAAYDDALRLCRLAPPPRRAGCAHVFHQYVVRSAERDTLRARLREFGIGTGIHYPVPVHLQPAYIGRVALGPSACRMTEHLSQEVLSLPMYPELTDAQIDRTCEALRVCG
jgi:dTDP-4-amino-4,6-dideoxygalactose transaminase